MEFTDEQFKEYLTIARCIGRKYPTFDNAPRWLNRLVSKAYNGSGLLMISNEIYNPNIKYDSYDLNSAYTSALLSHKYPLSWDVDIYEGSWNTFDDLKQFDGKLYIVEATFVNIKQKYPDFEYYLYLTSDCSTKVYTDEKGNIIYKVYMTNVDLLVFRMLYTYSDYGIHNIYVFKNVGYMPEDLTTYVKAQYSALQELKITDKATAKVRKKMIEILTYGKNAAKDKEWYKKTGDSLRFKRVPIATFQVAYVRLKMMLLFLKYQKYILKVDTDGIVVSDDCIFNEPISQNLGDFKREFHSKHVVNIRPKAYIVFNDDNEIVEYRFNGLKERLSDRQINELLNTGHTETNEWRSFKKPDGSYEEKYIKIDVDYLRYSPDNWFKLTSKQ